MAHRIIGGDAGDQSVILTKEDIFTGFEMSGRFSKANGRYGRKSLVWFVCYRTCDVRMIDSLLDENRFPPKIFSIPANRNQVRPDLQ